MLALSDYNIALRIDGNPEARRQIQAMEAGRSRRAQLIVRREDRDFNVPQQLTLYAGQEIAHETPIAIPVATRLTTRQLATKLNSDDSFVLVQAMASDGDCRAPSGWRWPRTKGGSTTRGKSSFKRRCCTLQTVI